MRLCESFVPVHRLSSFVGCVPCLIANDALHPFFTRLPVWTHPLSIYSIRLLLCQFQFVYIVGRCCASLQRLSCYATPSKKRPSLATRHVIKSHRIVSHHKNWADLHPPSNVSHLFTTQEKKVKLTAELMVNLVDELCSISLLFTAVALQPTSCISEIASHLKEGEKLSGSFGE